MSDVPTWLKGSTGPTLTEGPDAAPRSKERAVKTDFDVKPVVHAPALRRSGTDWADPPWLIGGSPRPVQIEALRRSIKGFALFDSKDEVERFRILRHRTDNAGFNYFMQMRLGKTYTIINDFYIQRWNTNVRWLIVLVPNFLKGAWLNDLAAVGVDVPTMAFDSDRRKEVEAFVARNRTTGGVLVVNYEALNSKATYALLSQISPIAMYAADESIKLKNPDGVQFDAAYKLADPAPRVVNASGKPVTQGPQDLFGQLQFAHQARQWRFPSFKVHFGEKGGFKGKQTVGVRNEDQLQALYMPRSFVARFADWYDGPGVEYAKPREVTLSPEQVKIMTELEKDMMTEINDNVTITAEQVLVRNMKQQQVRSGFIFDNESDPHVIVPWQKNPLVLELIRILREEVNHKAIIVAYYKPTMDMLQEALAEFNPAIIRSAQWHKENGRDIEGEKKRFNTDPGTRVLIGAETNLTYGHTLMGTKEDPVGVVIFFEQTASLNDRSQTEARPQGDGQQFPILMMDFFASELDRERVLALQRKEDVASVILGFARSSGILPNQL